MTCDHHITDFYTCKVYFSTELPWNGLKNPVWSKFSRRWSVKNRSEVYENTWKVSFLHGISRISGYFETTGFGLYKNGTRSTFSRHQYQFLTELKGKNPLFTPFVSSLIKETNLLFQLKVIEVKEHPIITHHLLTTLLLKIVMCWQRYLKK